MILNKLKFRNNILAYSIGIIYLWFGLLKFFPGQSPAEDLAISTMAILNFGFLPSQVSIVLLAVWETSIGIFLFANILKRFTFYLAIIHMIGTFTPVLFFPEKIFVNVPFAFTLVGQYIFKNIIIIAALISLKNENRNN